MARHVCTGELSRHRAPEQTLLHLVRRPHAGSEMEIQVTETQRKLFASIFKEQSSFFSEHTLMVTTNRDRSCHTNKKRLFGGSKRSTTPRRRGQLSTRNVWYNASRARQVRKKFARGANSLYSPGTLSEGFSAPDATTKGRIHGEKTQKD